MPISAGQSPTKIAPALRGLAVLPNERSNAGRATGEDNSQPAKAAGGGCARRLRCDIQMREGLARMQGFGMTRQRFGSRAARAAVLGLLIFVLAALAARPLVHPTPARAASPPNVVIILTDDQRWDEIDRMPNLQSELMNRGTTFANSFV